MEDWGEWLYGPVCNCLDISFPHIQLARSYSTQMTGYQQLIAKETGKYNPTLSLEKEGEYRVMSIKFLLQCSSSSDPVSHGLTKGSECHKKVKVLL